MKAVLDSGAFIAVDRRDPTIAHHFRNLRQANARFVTSANVVGQVWRGGSKQAVLARTIDGVDILAVDATVGRAIGELLRRSGTSDVVDAHVALLVESDDVVLTSDPEDIVALLDARGVAARVVGV